MGLENDDQAAVAQLARGLDGGPHLGRMVRVVVVDGRALEHTKEFHAPVCAGKRVQRARHVAEADAELQGHRRGARRVLDVVPARLPQVDVAQQVEPAIDRERTRRFAAIGRVVTKPIGDLARLRLQLPRELVVCAQHGEAFFRQALDEPLEQVAHRTHIAEVVGVVELDVGDDRALRVMQRERAVRFVGLGDEPFGRPGAGAGSVAHEHRRVVTGRDQDVAEHVRDRGLARGAGDRDGLGFVDELGEHLGAAEDPDSHGARCVELS